MKKIFTAVVLTGLLFILWGNVSAAPFNSNNKYGVNDWMRGADKPSLGIIDPSRLNVSHSASFGASFSNGNSLASSLIASHFAYQISNPLTLSFTVGMLNNRFGGGPYDGLTSSSLVGGFSLNWRPSDDFFMRFSFQRGPTSALPSTPDLRLFPYDSAYPEW